LKTVGSQTITGDGHGDGDDHGTSNAIMVRRGDGDALCGNNAGDGDGGDVV